MLTCLVDVLTGLICHKLSERSLFIDGNFLPLCARCTGIYIGVFLSFLFIYIKGRFSSLKPFSISCTVYAVFLLPMLWDGYSSYLNFRETSNFIRLLTGTALGATIPAIYLITYHFSINGQNNNVILSLKEYFLFVLLSEFFALLIYYGIINNYVFISVIIYLGIITGVIAMICLVFKRGKEILDKNNKTV